MRVFVYFFVGFFLFVGCALAQSKPTVSYLNRWPIKAPNVITKVGNYVFHGDGDIIAVYDAATDSDLTLVKTVPVRLTPAADLKDQQASGTEGVTGLFYDGDLLYAACGNEGLQIYDVPADPASFAPTDWKSTYIVEKQNARAVVRDVSVSGSYAYIGYYLLSNAGYDSGIQVVNITDPANPFLAGEVEFPQAVVELKRVQSVTVAGNYLYATDIYNGLIIFDLTDPKAPEVEAAYYISSAMDVAVSGNFAYVAAVFGVTVVNVDPANFTDEMDVLQSSATCQYAGEETKAVSLEANGGYAYVGDVDLGLVIIDTSSPEDVNDDSVIGGYSLDTQGAYSLFFDGANSDVYLGDCRKGLQKVDVEDPAATALLADVKDTRTPADADAVFVDTDTSYVFSVDDDASFGNIKEGVRIFFAVVSEEYVTFLSKGMLPTDGEATDIYFFDGYLYIADGSGGLKIIDAGLPEDTAGPVNPVLVSSVPVSGGNATGVFVKLDDDTRTYAYVAAGSGGLKVIDVSDPASPTLIGEISGTEVSDARKVDVKGNFAFIADGDNGLKIVDIADKSAPFLTGVYYVGDSDDLDDIPGCAYDLNIVGTLAYVAFYNEGLHVVGVSNPYEPIWVAQYSADPYYQVKGLYAARSSDNEGVDLIWIANGTAQEENMCFFTRPSTVPPQRIGGYYTAGDVKDVYVAADFAFLADSAGGLQALIVNEYESEVENSYLDVVVPVDTHRSKAGGCFIQTGLTGFWDGLRRLILPGR